MVSFTELGLNDSEAPEAASAAPHRGSAANPQAFDPATHAAGLRHRVSPPRDPAPSPEASVLAEEAQEQLKRAISALPSNLRIVLSMRDIEGFSSEETCNILGIRETNQRVLLHRARSKVRAALAPYLEGE
jgi:RNA polymerase sigma-70 factor (ECF subfamily)